MPRIAVIYYSVRPGAGLGLGPWVWAAALAAPRPTPCTPRRPRHRCTATCASWPRCEAAPAAGPLQGSAAPPPAARHRGIQLTSSNPPPPPHRRQQVFEGIKAVEGCEPVMFQVGSEGPGGGWRPGPPLGLLRAAQPRTRRRHPRRGARLTRCTPILLRRLRRRCRPRSWRRWVVGWGSRADWGLACPGTCGLERPPARPDAGAGITRPAPPSQIKPEPRAHYPAIRPEQLPDFDGLIL